MQLKDFIDVLKNDHHADCLYYSYNTDHIDTLFGTTITDSYERDCLMQLDKQIDESEIEWEECDEEYLDTLEELTKLSIHKYIEYLSENVNFKKALTNNPTNIYLLNKIAKICRDSLRDDNLKLILRKDLKLLKQSIYDQKNKFLERRPIKEYHKFEYDNEMYNICPYYEVENIGLHGEPIEDDVNTTETIKNEINSEINIEKDYNPSVLTVFGVTP